MSDNKGVRYLNNADKVFSANTHLVLNISPINFKDAEIEVGVLPYKDKDSLLDLRHNHATHLFRREGGTEVLSVPIINGTPGIGDTFKKIRLKDNLGLAAALMRNAFINHLVSMPRKVYGYQPIEFLADQTKNNFLTRCSSLQGIDLSWLAICPLYETDYPAAKFESRK